MLNRASAQDPQFHPVCQTVTEDGTARIAISGDWTLAVLERVHGTLGQLGPLPQTSGPPLIDLGALQMLDTAGALALVGLRQRTGASDFSNARPEHQILLDEVARAVASTSEPSLRPQPLADFIRAFLSGLTAIGRDALALTIFLGETAAALGRVIAKPSKFRGTSFIHQVQMTGLTAVPIISLVCVLIGGVVMQQGARQLRNFGAETLSIDMLGILALREVGVVLAAVMVAGRSASAFTAQIGTMKMREEIDAMRTLGIDPIETSGPPAHSRPDYRTAASGLRCRHHVSAGRRGHGETLSLPRFPDLSPKAERGHHRQAFLCRAYQSALRGIGDRARRLPGRLARARQR